MACAEMGLAYSSHRTTTGPTDNFSMDDLRCPSGALQLSHCTYHTNENCSRGESIALTCTEPTFSIQSGVLYWGSGPVCRDYFSSNSGKMACAEMGLAYSTWRTTTGPTDNFTIDDVRCPWGALQLSQCTYTTSENCSRGDSVALTCTTPTFSIQSGVLYWGSGPVCAHSFSSNSGEMACTEMGLAYSSHRTTTGPTDNFSMDDVRCPSGALQLSHCTYHTNENCSRGESIALTCTEPTFSIQSGVLYWGAGPVCNDYFSSNSGKMACTEIGLAYSSHRTTT